MFFEETVAVSLYYLLIAFSLNILAFFVAHKARRIEYCINVICSFAYIFLKLVHTGLSGFVIVHKRTSCLSHTNPILIS